MKYKIIIDDYFTFLLALSSSFVHPGNAVVCLNTRAPQHFADISVTPILNAEKTEAQQLTHLQPSLEFNPRLLIMNPVLEPR